MILRRFASVGFSRICLLRVSFRPSASPIYSIRNVRTNITSGDPKKNGHQDRHEEKPREEKAEESNFEGEKGEPGSGQQPPHMSPELTKKLRIYSVVVTLMSFVVTYAALKRFTNDGGEHSLIEDLRSESISMNEFLHKYLPSGEVQRVTYMPTENKAAAWLQDGAIIDGKLCPHKVVLIDYKRVEGQPMEQFSMEVRHTEEKLGIPMSQGVPIQVVQGFTPFKLMELIIGLGIVMLLATQYGRLIRRKMLEQQAQASKGAKKPPTS